MNIRFSELRCKEVICVNDGQRLGFVCDVKLDTPEGCVTAIVVPGPCKLFGIASPKDDYVIPWNCIRRIGPDIILVDIKPCDCRVPRSKMALFGSLGGF